MLVGLVRWYFVYRVHPLAKEVAQYLPKLRHRRNTADDGGRAA